MLRSKILNYNLKEKGTVLEKIFGYLRNFRTSFHFSAPLLLLLFLIIIIIIFFYYYYIFVCFVSYFHCCYSYQVFITIIISITIFINSLITHPTKWSNTLNSSPTNFLLTSNYFLYINQRQYREPTYMFEHCLAYLFTFFYFVSWAEIEGWRLKSHCFSTVSLEAIKSNLSISIFNAIFGFYSLFYVREFKLFPSEQISL